MALVTGARLGPYEVLGPIGAGGMGEVYRARDTSLNRDVAIKVLPTAFADDPERLARFKREAEALAAVNHPNIAHVYGLVHAGDTRALAMELVEGNTLQDLMELGPIPRDEALSLAEQIADALEAAHDRGIIHRDLKPANIKVRDDGVVKVLDFGLAKAIAPDSPDPRGSAMATVTSPSTRLGVILGTPAYMSPEQARGRPVDRRTDMWAFGCVLYEMLTGRRAFEGEDVAEILGKVLERTPDLSHLPPGTPAPVRRLLRRCFEKAPRDRLPGAASARLEIKDARTISDADATTPVTAAGHWWRRPIPVAALCFVLGAAAALAAVWSLPGRPRSTARLDIVLPHGFVYPDALNGVAISPDGTTVVFVAERAGVRYLLRRGIDELAATPMSDTEDAYDPFFSDDGEWVSFFTRPEAKVKRVRLSGGSAETLLGLSADQGSWGSGGTLDGAGQLVFGTHSKGLFRVTTKSGALQAEPLTTEREQGPHRFPGLLPGGSLLFTMGGTPDANQAGVLPAAPGSQWRAVMRGTDAQYLPTGHVVFWRDNSLWAVPFDLDRLEPVGQAVVAVEGARVSPNGRASYAWSKDGVLAYVPSSDAPARSLAWVTRDGKESVLKGEPGPYSRPELSERDTHILLTRIGWSGEDIYVHDIARGLTSPLSEEPFSEMGAIWWPGEQRVVLASRRSGPFGLYTQALGGAGRLELLASPAGVPSDWTRDGRRILHAEQSRLSIYSLDTKKTEPVLDQPGLVFGSAQVSPDDKWFAYHSTERAARHQIFVRPLAAPHLPRVQVSLDGGTEPRWSPNGRELFFRDGTSVMRATVKTSPEFGVIGTPVLLLDGPYAPGYDIDSTGRRFLMIKEPPASAVRAERLIVVLNWFEELKRLLPSR